MANPSYSDADLTSLRNTRSAARYFQRRLVSQTSNTSAIPSPDTNSADMSSSPTIQSSPSFRSAASNTLSPNTGLRTLRSPFRRRTAYDRETREQLVDVININNARSTSSDSIDEKDLNSKANIAFVLDPRGKFRSLWDLYILIVLVYVMLVSVFIISFNGILGLSSPWFWIERLIDISFVIDIILHFFTKFEKDNGEFEDDPVKFRSRYVRTWFTVDVLATFPWDVLAMIIYNQNNRPTGILFPRYLRLLRLARLFRVLRILRLNDKFTEIEVKLKLKHGHLRLATLTIVVLLVSHWFACLFYYFGEVFRECVQETAGAPCTDEDYWFRSLQFEAEEANEGFNNFDKYIASLYFSVYTITTIGYGDVAPVNTGERTTTILLMLFGAAMFATIISQMSNAQDDLNELRAEHRKKLDRLTEYTRVHEEIDDGLALKMREWIQDEQRRSKVIDEEELLDSLNEDLRREVIQRIYGDVVKDSRLFQDVQHPDKLRRVFSSLKHKYVRQGERLYLGGEKPDGFYVVKQGCVETKFSSGEFQRHMEGEVFGEDGVFFGRRRDHDAICYEDSELMFIPREAVMLTLEDSEEAFKRVEEEETLRLWSKAMEVVEGQIRYANVARELREKGEGFLRKKGVAVRVQGSGRGKVMKGVDSVLKQSVSALDLGRGTGSRRHGDRGMEYVDEMKTLLAQKDKELKRLRELVKELEGKKTGDGEE